MTVKELEKVSAPPKTGEDAREERARLLEAAALEIEVRGWLSGTREHRGKVCLIAAVGCAIANDPWYGPSYEAARDAFGHGGDSMVLPDWNDRVGRTADEVTFLLRWRAEEIRDGR